MGSSFVVKVKNGETLRRFSVGVLENNKLDLDINGLRTRILDLFNFSSDTDFTLTYVDEDGDIVTLVNDDDLHDVTRQRLTFLRIDVHLRNEKNDQSNDRSVGSSTPLMSTRGRRSFCNAPIGISDVLKPLPEPLREVCSQFLHDVASKAAVTSPVLAELAQSFIRLGNTHLNSDSQSSSVPGASTENVATQSSKTPLGAESKASKDGAYKDNKIINSESVAKNIGVAVPASVDLNSLPCDSIASGIAIGKSAYAAPCGSSFDGKTEGGKRHNDVFYPHREMDVLKCNNPHFPLGRYLDNDSFLNGCPFSGVPMATSMLGTAGIDPRSSTSDYIEPVGSMFHKGQESSSGYFETVGSAFPKGQVSGSSGHIDSKGSIFHRGVICDGCGAHPITGPRFKSQVKDDYDLCSICFAEMGNYNDYTRIDRPVSCRHPRLKSFNRRHPFGGPRMIDTLRNSGKQAKLNSRFVADVNFVDGTVVAPFTPFTKIWRLYNSGSLNWPRGTQLVWTEGAKFSRSVSVEAEVPADGLPPGQEIDIAVDFVSPPIPGHFVSYWVMASPSGQKFGQRVWVDIKVCTAIGMEDFDNSPALDLNLPPIVTAGSGGSNGHEDVTKDSAPAVPDTVSFPPRVSSPIAKPVEPDHNPPESETEQQFLINEDLLVGKSPATSVKKDDLVSYPAVDCDAVLPFTTKVTSVSCPLIDFYEPVSAASPRPPPPTPTPKVSPASPEKVTANSFIEETLLETLRDMGFNQVNLNKEILKKNGYDLEKSVDELCGVDEWDAILEELDEMGFGDKGRNRKLLMKNNGSMKQVVLELLYGEEMA